MQKHQTWIENRSYQQHLLSLEKIKARKNNTPNPTKRHKKHYSSKVNHDSSKDKLYDLSSLLIKQKTSHNSQRVSQSENQKQIKNQEEFKVKSKIHQNQIAEDNQISPNDSKINFFSDRKDFLTNENFFHRNKGNIFVLRSESKDITHISLKQQELLWNNFLLGKRILETSPVISKRKLQLDYRKHQELLKSKTSKRLHENSNFRLRKLQQHNDKIFKISDEHRIQNTLHKQYMINLLIQSVQIFKYKFSSFENIIVIMKYAHSEVNLTQNPHKRTKQVSECIPSSMLTSFNFFFTFRKRLFDQNIPVTIEIKNVKSLNVISIGSFSFQFNQKKQLQTKEANLFSFGKLIGNVRFKAVFGKKSEFISS